MQRTLALAAATLALASGLALTTAQAPAGAPASRPVIDEGVRKLATQLTGSFASTAQSKDDPDYFDIRLHMARIWNDRTDGIWLYVEQAVAERPEAPYRQRVYRVYRRDDGKLVSAVYTLPGTPVQLHKKYAGAWKDVTKLKDLTPEQLTLRAGCEMLMEELPNGNFRGGTEGKNCASDLRNASYATSEADVSPQLLKTWDRGFNAEDKQVWGAEKGPYHFDRQVERRPATP